MQKFSILLVFVAAFPSIGLGQVDTSQCSDVLAEHLLDKRFEYNYSNSKYLYAERYSSMEWKEFKDEFESSASIPIKGIPVDGSISRSQFEEWKKQVQGSVNISDIQTNKHTLMLSSAKIETINAWESCMLNRNNQGVFAYLEPISSEISQLRLTARPGSFQQEPPKVDGSYFLDNAKVANGQQFLTDGMNLDLDKIITIRRKRSDRPVIFNMNTTKGAVEAFSPSDAEVPAWPNNILVQHRFSFNTNFAAGVWRDINSPPSSAFPIAHIAGDNARGLIIAGGEDGKSLWYMNDYASGVWNQILDAPFRVKGLSGENGYGPLIYGGDSNRTVAFLNNYSRQRWTVIATPAPFQIKGMTGTNQRGVIIYGGSGNREVYFLNNYGAPNWVKVANAPFTIKGIVGENGQGPLIHGGSDGRSVAYMNNYAQNKWHILPNAPDQIDFLAGNNSKGALVLNESSSYFYYLRDFAAPVWVARTLRKSGVAMAAGENGRGLIVGLEH